MLKQKSIETFNCAYLCWRSSTKILCYTRFFTIESYFTETGTAECHASACEKLEWRHSST